MTTKRNPLSYQPTYSIRFCSNVASCNHFFFPLYFSFYLSRLFVPSFLTFVLSVLFSSFLFPLLVYFLLPAFIYFVISFSLFIEGIYYLFIHLVFLYFLPSCVFLHFSKFLNTLKLYIYIKKKPEYWTNGRSTTHV